jgi:hypothetical protein
MNRTRAAFLGLLAVSLTVSVHGCGDEGTSDFQADYNQAIRPLTEVTREIGQLAGQKVSNREVAREFGRIADTAEQAHLSLSKLEPPDEARSEFQALVSGIQTYTRNLRAVARSARESKPLANRRAVRKLSRTTDEVARAETAFKNAVQG